MSDDFFEVPSSTVPTSQGPVELPMLFYDVSVRRFNFLIDHNAALAELAGTGLAPYCFRGRALASLILYNNRDVGIGPYDEVAISLQAYPLAGRHPGPYRPGLRRKDGYRSGVGAHVLEMAVTAEAALAAAREIWGYPTCIADIPLELSDRRFSCVVLDEPGGEELLSVRCAPGPGVTVRAGDLVTFSNHEHTILRTVADVDARYRYSAGRNFRIEAGSSDHRFARRVRDLRLDRTRPFSVQCTDSFRCRLNRGWPVASLA